MFARVPRGFWDQPANRRRYVLWLGRQLKFGRTGKWYGIRRDDIRGNYGGGLIAHCKSYLNLLEECLPDLDWHSRTVA